MTNNFSERNIEVTGATLHCVCAGEGPLMLFLHGFPEFWYMWKQQLGEFSKTHFTVAPDLRGYNLSSKPARVEDYKISFLVNDVKELIEKLGYKKAILVAHDWGGAIAWAFAIKHPQLVEKLVILNAPHPAIFGRELRSNPEQQKASEYMLFLRSADAENILRKNNFEWLVESTLSRGLRKGYVGEKDLKAYIDAWSQPGALTGAVNYYRASGVGPAGKSGEVAIGTYTAELGTDLVVRVPTLVLWGEWDRALLIGNLKNLEKYVPDLKLKILPETSHWVVQEKSAEVNQQIREFIG
jgi:pimeloyl-ACP methyl ester carboxylesterase